MNINGNLQTALAENFFPENDQFYGLSASVKLQPSVGVNLH